MKMVEDRTRVLYFCFNLACLSTLQQMAKLKPAFVKPHSRFTAVFSVVTQRSKDKFRDKTPLTCLYPVQGYPITS